ncbi:MAG: TetR family transcriptional regulator [Mycobacterium sp.]|nr:MAG: TetR family transcriptional regulator [Mycobacterium sp.]
MQLHKREVVEAATAILDNHGIADLTMRRLARELDVSPGALYWHFASKQQLLGAVADRILAPVCAEPDGGHWSDRIIRVGVRLRDALRSHTDGAELVSASFAAGQSASAAEMLARLTAAATDAGLDPEQSVLAARTIVYYVLGFTVDEQARLQWDAAGAAAIPPAADPDRDFAVGLQLLIDGLTVRARRRRSSWANPDTVVLARQQQGKWDPRKATVHQDLSSGRR